MTSRIPFDYALIDARHQPFAEGRRNQPLSLFQVVASGALTGLILSVVVGGALLFWGARSLIYDLSVKWLAAEAVITQIYPVQSGNQFNWWYYYSFTAENGEAVDGKLALDNNNAFSVGDKIPVIYARSDPKDNRYANETLPHSILDWFFVGMSVFLLGNVALRLRRDLASYRLLNRIARLGRPLPGKIVKAELVAARVRDFTVDIEYMFGTPEGENITARTQVRPLHLARKTLPEPGANVAVWYAGEAGALLI